MKCTAMAHQTAMMIVAAARTCSLNHPSSCTIVVPYKHATMKLHIR